MTRTSVEDYAAAIRKRYRTSSKREKQRILDEFCATTGHHRKAAIRLLAREARARKQGGGRKRQYGPLVAEPLRVCWEVSGRICSKRLAPFLAELVPVLERHGELQLTAEVRAALLAIRPTSIDGLLKSERRHLARGPAHRPTGVNTIRAQIPIRTSGEWKDVLLGSVQADLVEHCGEDASGSFLYTLTVVEVLTGWTECRPVMNKTMDRVCAAIHRVRTNLPMPLTALHTDNGSEFMNEHLSGYCRRERIRFTRGRAYRKNDQAFVEQRNWSAVRQWVGYSRYSSKVAYRLLEQLYEYQRLYVNFFQPVRKLVAKERIGAHVTKHFDQAATPYQRLLATGQLDVGTARQLAQLYNYLNPRKLLGQIEQTERELWEARELPKTARANRHLAGADQA